MQPWLDPTWLDYLQPKGGVKTTAEAQFPEVPC